MSSGTPTLQPQKVMKTIFTLVLMMVVSESGWDIRQDNNKPALELKDTSQHTGPPLNKNKPLLCVAANDSGLIVAGTEQVGQDAYLLFWDMKNGGEMVGGYWSVHSDDVTCLKFSDDAQV